MASGRGTEILKIIGIIALVWLGFQLLQPLWHVLGWALVIGGLGFAGYVGYRALRGRGDPPALP